MPIAQYILDIRRRIGHEMLYLPGIKAVVINDRREVLLQKNRDTGKWMPIGGMIEPGEEPADAAVREVFEETSIRVAAVRLIGVYAGPDVHYPNGDHCVYLSIAFLCKPLEGHPRVNDDESLEVAYFPLSDLPPLRADHQLTLRHALSDRPESYFSVRADH